MDGTSEDEGGIPVLALVLTLLAIGAILLAIYSGYHNWSDEMLIEIALVTAITVLFVFVYRRLGSR